MHRSVQMNSNYTNVGISSSRWMFGFVIVMTFAFADSFQSSPFDQQRRPVSSFVHRQQFAILSRKPSSQLYFFGKGKEDASNGEKQTDGDYNKDGNSVTTNEKKPFSIPFFGRLTMDEKQSETESLVQESTRLASSTSVVQVPEKEVDSDNPEVLRAKAERARLEAERMDAELTLSKIDKLERQLIKAKSKGDSIVDLQRQLDALQAKLRGDPPPTITAAPKPTPAVEPVERRTVTSSETLSQDISASVTDEDVLKAARKMSSEDSTILTLDDDDLTLLPEFIVKILANIVGIEGYGRDENMNKTEVLRRWEMVKNLDYSFMANYTSPTFTPAQIAEAKKAIQEEISELPVSDRMVEKAGGNATQLALYALEYQAFIETNSAKVNKMPLQDITPEFIQDLINENAGFGLFSSIYPKCTRKEGQEPTQAQVDALVKTVLPAAKFSSSSKPEKVPGGYIITGSHKFKNGDDLIDAIDRELAKTSLADKMTVLYAPATTQPVNSSGMMNESLESLEQFLLSSDVFSADPGPILYITGPDIVREPNRIGLTVTSILGFATSWYLSIYPFLLNEGIGKRVDQELQLLEANLQPDLTWLTDLSFPLFVTFIALQLVHEAAHRLVAASNGVKLTVPTFVPSLITGITSSVTTFKTLPKNKEAMFDISAAGPLAGIVASSVALAIGSKLTLISDPSILPALPLDILRQSTLGGAIIDNIIQGSLYVPEGAPTAGIMISLHPVAIAGYISLVVNALSLLPIGTTDGGRLTMALFNRLDKGAIGSLTALALLYFGLFGSDLFLFYFSFVIAFQTGNEVPARNEEDPVSFSRVIVAIIAYALAFVSLVPIQ
ncbi:peptidase M50 family protein [Nitzschia inconspicua]|uniref:Peptidase M50 family protein n=1 Tax=Nitzschia inconspicua TaxID=303405 RepID=A0A9K3PX71_9STRA|nr:peptidase M50 family protein [Nitzschia inconspicua]